MIKALFVALVITAAACGGKHADPATMSNHAATAESEGAEHQDMMNMPPEISKFHEVIGPRWHAEKGPQRMKDTCSAMPDFHASADALAKATSPSILNADMWMLGTSQLVDAVAGLDATCKSNDAATFETAFAKVHQSFDGLLSQARGL